VGSQCRSDFGIFVRCEFVADYDSRRFDLKYRSLPTKLGEGLGARILKRLQAARGMLGCGCSGRLVVLALVVCLFSEVHTIWGARDGWHSVYLTVVIKALCVVLNLLLQPDTASQMVLEFMKCRYLKYCSAG